MSPRVHQDSAGEPLYKLFRAIKHQIEKGPVDASVKKAKYTLNDTGLLGDDVEYSVLVRRARTEITLTRKPGLKIPARLQDRSTDTERSYRGNRPKPPHHGRLPAIVRHPFSFLVLGAPERHRQREQ